MPCVHAYAFAARSGMLEHPGPSGFFDQYFEACFRVAHILKGLEGLSIAVPQLTSVKVCGNSVGPPVPVKRPGRPPREQGKRGPKPKDKRFKSRGGLIAAKIKRSGWRKRGSRKFLGALTRARSNKMPQAKSKKRVAKMRKVDGDA